MRKIEDEREARAFLKAAKSSGVPLKAWARDRGIDGRSLNAWRMNLARSRASARGRSTPRLPSPSQRGEHRPQVHAVDQLEGHPPAALVLGSVEQRHDVRVRERRRDAGLEQEAADPLGVARLRAAQALQADALDDRRVGRT